MNILLYSLKNFKKAFTLAEVLITLGIIGVVAAMTMPALSQRTKYKEFETRFKVAENLLHNAVAYFHTQNKMISEDTFCTANAYTNCQMGDVFSEVLAEAFIAVHLLNEGGNGYYGRDAGNYYNFTSQTKFNESLLDDGYMELNNGMSVIIESGTASSRPIIFFDLNGTSVKPNQIGHDTFAFIIDTNDRVCPLGSPMCTGRPTYVETETDFTKSNYCSPSSSSNSNGITCGYYASIDKDYFNKIR